MNRTRLVTPLIRSCAALIVVAAVTLAQPGCGTSGPPPGPGGGDPTSNDNGNDPASNDNGSDPVANDNGTEPPQPVVFNWTQEAKLTAAQPHPADLLGHAVSLSDGVALTGAYRSDAGCDVERCDAGAAHVYRLEGDAWVEEAVLTASDAADDDFFGFAVAVSGAGAIVGASGVDDMGSSSGAAYVYRRNGSAWVEQAKLVPDDGGVFDNFGYTVGISADLAVVGGWGSDVGGPGTGQVYVYRFSSGRWSLETKLQGSTASSGDNFGRSVDIDGHVIVVGSWHDDPLGNNSGSVSVFRHDASADLWTEEALLTPSDGAAEDLFGHDVGVHGDLIVVGARHDDDACDDDPECNSGSVYVYRFTGTAWVEEDKLTASDAMPAANFGYAVDVAGDSLIVGAWNENDGAAALGSAYLYGHQEGRWSEIARLAPDELDNGDLFGISVSMDGGATVVGSSGDSERGIGAGAAYVFRRTPQSD